MKKNIVKSWASLSGLFISEPQLGKMSALQLLVLESNKVMNLTAITKDEDFALKHFIDSLTLLPYLEDANSLCDIGSGAGFPGLVLAIMKENISFTLIDSIKKRALFLEKAISTLELKNVRCLHMRAEDCNLEFDIVTARAVAPLKKLAKWGLPLVKSGGKLLAMKGFDVSEELPKAEAEIKKQGGIITKTDRIEISPGLKRTIINLEKVSKNGN